MSVKMANKSLEQQISIAVRHFWQTRNEQHLSQGSRTGQRDTGNRTAATGGKQLDGFRRVFVEALRGVGVPAECIFTDGRAFVTLPGYFRPTKQWDLLVVFEQKLLAAIELKALCGPSFGNNYNNRVEEALGSSTDIWTAYREGLFGQSPKPFVGYVLLLEESVRSLAPVETSNLHFPVPTSFQKASYAVRCEETVRRMVLERCYDAGAFILSERESGSKGFIVNLLLTCR